MGFRRASEIIDEGMKTVAGFTELSELTVEGCGHDGNEGSRVISRLPKLAKLGISWTAVGDDGMRHLSQLPSLKYLGIRHTKVSDRGLEHLMRCQSLSKISIAGTQITGEDVVRLQTALPNCVVERTE